MRGPFNGWVTFVNPKISEKFSSVSLDEKDIAILIWLSENGRESFSEIGRRLGISRVAVWKRFVKITSSGLAKPSCLVNPKKLGLEVLALWGRVRDPTCWGRLTSSCPRLAFSFRTGEIGLAVLLFEKEAVKPVMSVNCFEGYCLKPARLLPAELPPTAFTRLRIPSNLREKPPCGLADCRRCEYYLAGCPGCPATKYYKGFLRLPKLLS